MVEESFIESAIEDSCRMKQSFSDELKRQIIAVAEAILNAHRNQQRVFIIGNGGSAADALHFSSELVGRFLKEREPLDVLALSSNIPTLTSLINDYPAEQLFARQVKAHVRKGDIVIGISTSGKSRNILLALETARERGAKTIGFSGETGGDMHSRCDLLLCVPSRKTPRIQEGHLFMIHLICHLVEDWVAPGDAAKE